MSKIVKSRIDLSPNPNISNTNNDLENENRTFVKESQNSLSISKNDR